MGARGVVDGFSLRTTPTKHTAPFDSSTTWSENPLQVAAGLMGLAATAGAAVLSVVDVGGDALEGTPTESKPPPHPTKQLRSVVVAAAAAAVAVSTDDDDANDADDDDADAVVKVAKLLVSGGGATKTND